MNWQEHASNFNRLRAETGISIREYAEQYNLNPNTARRYLRSANSAPADDHVNDHTAKHDQHSSPKKARQEKENVAKIRTHTDILRENKRGTNTSKRNPQVKNAKSGNAKMITSPDVIMMHQKLPRGKGRRLAVGNEIAMKHGRYATPRSIDLNKADTLMDAGYLDVLEVDLMRRALAHFELVERVRDRSIEELEKQEAEFAMSAEEGALHPAFKQLKMLNDCSYAMTDFMRTMAAMKQGLLKTRRDEEKHAAKMGETTAIATAYQHQQAHEWGAMQTAIYIESQGGKVPPVLLETLRHEMKQGQNEDVDNGVIDQDELDREARAYRDKQAGRDAYIATKRRQVSDIVDRGGYGDKNHYGEGREGELLEALDDEPDYDYEATEDVYVDEDNS
ncbi:hypothetical protein Xmau_03038 [Xenorhabdus mauleonii]|uniref:Terminase n=2 Tax=Xenorhabdus mauleonii TaxID=351675 RepID=A0A1I3SFW0_9GAMM|nr:hypothetical protein Xmau_03038 [Xenorhabdus mauleonii]SFJ56337.1 hypothetical protein SAMN05421680_11159 [Xenorhabdus mauleonii]